MTVTYAAIVSMQGSRHSSSLVFMFITLDEIFFHARILRKLQVAESFSPLLSFLFLLKWAFYSFPIVIISYFQLNLVLIWLKLSNFHSLVHGGYYLVGFEI
jgi:hypothetical protein